MCDKKKEPNGLEIAGGMFFVVWTLYTVILTLVHFAPHTH